MNSRQRIRFQSGLTIPELMLGLVIFAIVTSLGVPSFQSLMRKNEMKAQVGLITSSLAYARSEAVSRQKNISVCASGDGSTCDGGGDWSLGWIVFIDENQNSTIDASDGDELLKLVGGSAGQATLEVISGVPVMHFTAAGESLNGEVTLELCAGDVEEADDTVRSRTITVSAVGSARVAKGAACGHSG